MGIFINAFPKIGTELFTCPFIFTADTRAKPKWTNDSLLQPQHGLNILFKLLTGAFAGSLLVNTEMV